MLSELVVSNLGVIEHAGVVLSPGLTALTGETGAGKTLVTEAVALLLGGRADSRLVRAGADEAVVEGRFVRGDGDEFVVRRVVPASGRSRAYVDGSMATVAQLEELMPSLVEIHGQHGQQALLRPAARRLVLDRFGGCDPVPLRDARRAVAEALSELEGLGGDEVARAREIEVLRHQIDEIAAATIAGPDEDAELQQREAVLGDATGHVEAAEAALAALSVDGPAGSAIAEALAALRDRAPFDGSADRLYAVQTELGDIVDGLRGEAGLIDDDPATLHQVQQRRELLTALRRKYGPALADVLSFAADAQGRLDELENHGERARELSERLEQLRAAETDAAEILGAARRGAAPELAGKVGRELRKLALPKAELAVDVDGVAGESIDFAISTSPGSPLLPFAKVASGGELSRIMLALQLVVGSAADTVIYDEVDAGVGGEAATSIGRALAGVARRHQVLVVTHLPQVAACADHQLNIVKTIRGSTTRTELHELDHDARVVELARMLSGSPDSENARAHAAELLAAAAAS